MEIIRLAQKLVTFFSLFASHVGTGVSLKACGYTLKVCFIPKAHVAGFAASPDAHTIVRYSGGYTVIPGKPRGSSCGCIDLPGSRWPCMCINAVIDILLRCFLDHRPRARPESLRWIRTSCVVPNRSQYYPGKDAAWLVQAVQSVEYSWKVCGALFKRGTVAWKCGISDHYHSATSMVCFYV